MRPNNPPAWTALVLNAALAFLALTPCAVAQGQDPGTPASQGDAPAAAATPPKALISGQLVSRFLARWTGNEHDTDIYEVLSLDIGDPEQNAVSAHLMGRLSADLDGYDPTFASIDDARGRRVDGMLYEAYVDLHRAPGLDLLRLGRQSLYDTPITVYFDGARAETHTVGAAALQFGAYGGAATHYYESSPQGDLLGGVYAKARPWTGGRVRLDYLHAEDQTQLGDHKDDLLGLGVWQQVSAKLSAEAQYTRLQDHNRDVRSRIFFADPGADLTLQVSYYQLLTTQGDLVLELDPLFSALHELFPYYQFSVLAGKGIAETLQVQAGTDMRRVDDRGDIGTYNRDYWRYYFTATLIKLGVRGLSAGATADFWNSDSQLVRTWGADLTEKVDNVTASIGSNYALYSFDLFSNFERDHVRTYYARLRKKLNAAVSLDAGYELQDSDLDRFHTFRMGVTWRF
jgi:hypothetical protein